MLRPARLMLTATLLLGMVPAAHAAGPGSTLLADLPQGLGPTGLTGQENESGTAGERTLSADGNRVLFRSDSDGLSAADDDRQMNLFVRDRAANQILLVNVGLGGTPADRGGYQGQISGDGTRVVFISEATNLVEGVTDGTQRVYLRDLTAGTTTLVSRADGPGGAAAGYSSGPAISRDGTTVAFSTETSLDAADGNTTSDVYVRKLAGNDTILASRASGGGLVGDQGSYDPSLAADGNTVAFQSDATNLAEPGVTDTNFSSDIYSRTLAGVTKLVSRRDAASTSGDGSAFSPSISPGGGFVAFETVASNLDSGVADTNGTNDVYVRGPGGTDLVSRANGLAGAVGTGSSSSPALGFRSSDSDVLVAFVSNAPQLTGDATSTDQIVLRNVTDGTTEVVSRAGAAVGDAPSFGPAVDDGAAHVAYGSFATNVGLSGGERVGRVLLSDPDAGTTDLISRPASGPLTADLNGSDLDRGRRQVSADGRYVVFASGTDALLGGLPGDDANHVFRKDLLTGAVVRVDPGSSGGASPDSANDPSMSADGNVVAFETSGTLDPADTNGSSDVYVRDIAAATTRLASRAGGPAGAVGDGGSGDAAISGDGLRVAFETSATNLGNGDVDTDRDVHSRDLLASTTTLVSRADGPGGAPGNGESGDPDSDADGSVVAFESSASNLGDGDSDTSADAHLRDLAAGTTRLASRASGAAGAQGNGSSSDVSISADGLRVAFESSATNLVPEDTDSSRDVLVRDLSSDATTLVSRADGVAGAPGENSSADASISADASSVAFETSATNLGAISAPTFTNDVIAVRHLATATTTLVSRADGPEGARLTALESAADPGLSGDGSCAVFESRAATLLPPGVSADFTRVFLRVLARECPFDPPETSITAGPAGTVSTPANAFAFASDEPGSTFECRIDGAAFAPCTAPVTTAALADGAHLFEARATDAAGFQDATPAQRAFTIRRAVAVPPDKTVPRLTQVSLTRKRFRVGPKATAIAAATRRSPIGTTVRYTLSETSTVRLTIARRESGRRVGTSCRKATRALRKRKSCTRYATRGTLRRAARVGTNRVAFSGRIGRRALPRGTYRVSLTATDPAGNRSATRTLTFTVVKR